MAWNPNRAFRKRGNTVVLNVGTASTALTATSFTGLLQRGLGIDFVVNNGAAHTVYLAFDSTATGAAAKAVVPSTAASQDVYVCLAGTVQIVNEPQDMYAAAIATAATTLLTLTPGEGS